jgi:hypothetical protein
VTRTATDDLIALTCKALSERYPDDKGGRPGLLIAHLPEGKGEQDFYVTLSGLRFPATADVTGEPRWYVAAQRFLGPGKGEGRTNVQRWTGDELDDVIAEAAKFLATSVEHQAELGKAVGE